MNESERDDIARETDRNDEEKQTQIIAISIACDDIAFRCLHSYEVRRRLRKAKPKDTHDGRRHTRYAGRGRSIPDALPVLDDISVERTKADLYEEARRCDIPGRSRMSKSELATAIEAC